MRVFDDLTRRGKIGRFRKLADLALARYGLSNARMSFLRLAGNALFRVHEDGPRFRTSADDVYQPGQYLLRIHDRNEQPTDAIKLEMAWLSAMSREAGLPVPQPIPSRDGKLLTRVSSRGIPDERDCTILRWVKGRCVTKRFCPRHFEAQGEVMAQMHNFSSKWRSPQGLEKRHFDYDGLFMDDAGAGGFTNKEAWHLLPKRLQEPYRTVARRTMKAMTRLGKGAKVYGLIHADCGVDANMLFWNGKPRVIDFDSSGFGYYLFDLAITLEHLWEDPGYPVYLEALLRGYTKHRALPANHIELLNLFRAAFYVYMGLWTVAVDQTFPDSPNRAGRHEKWIDYGLKFVKWHLKG
jgi:Ser/Thr protein kinase RdoA (MazF antagonist)